jgi:hypothetical protein
MKNGLIIGPDDNIYTYYNNFLHEMDGPAAISPDGTHYQYYDGTQHWYIGKDKEFHRWDGPAIIEQDGTQHWFIYGKDITEELSKYFNKDLYRETLTKSELLIFELKWS